MILSPKSDVCMKELFRNEIVRKYFISDVLEIHILELRKKLDGNHPINDWIRFFNAQTKEDLDMIQTKNPGILEAIREIQTMSLSRRLKARYEAWLKYKRDLNAMREYDRDEGRAEGHAEGLTEAKKRIAQNLLSSGCSIENISKICEESPEQIHAWLDEWI